MSATIVERVLSAAELRALSGRSDRAGARRVAIHVALLVASGWLLAIAPGWWALPAMLPFGLVQVALFAPAHETMHNTAFASRRANAVVGWLAACPSLLNAQFYACFHLAHHRHTQIAGEDPELGTAAPTGVASYVWRIIGVPFWTLRLRVIGDCWRGDLRAYPYVSEQAAPRVIRSVRAMSLFMFGGAAVSGVLFGWETPLLFWIGPQLLCQPALRAYTLQEHTGCSMDRNGLTNTRTTLTWRIVRLLMWNMPYHAEHHMYPSIPFHRLPDAHTAMRARLGFVQRGYVRWNASLLRSLWLRQA